MSKRRKHQQRPSKKILIMTQQQAAILLAKSQKLLEQTMKMSQEREKEFAVRELALQKSRKQNIQRKKKLQEGWKKLRAQLKNDRQEEKLYYKKPKQNILNSCKKLFDCLFVSSPWPLSSLFGSKKKERKKSIDQQIDQELEKLWKPPRMGRQLTDIIISQQDEQSIIQKREQ